MYRWNKCLLIFVYIILIYLPTKHNVVCFTLTTNLRGFVINTITFPYRLSQSSKSSDASDVNIRQQKSAIRSLLKGKPKLNSPNSSSPIDKLPASSTSTMNPRRKEHKNKYSQFSSNTDIIDPLEAAKAKQDEMKSMGNDLSAPVRGTTVPVRNQTLVTDNSSVSFPSYNQIVPSDPYTFGFVQIGTVLGPHGVKGEMKVKLETDFADMRIKPDSILYIKRPNRRTPRPITVKKGRKQIDDIFLIQFSDINSRLSASVFRDYNVYVRASDRPMLNEDEHLIRDLVDLSCYSNFTLDDDGKEIYDGYIGKVNGVIPADELCDPATASLMHAMLEIRKPGLAGELCLIPFVPSIVLRVSYDQRAILIDPPEGLLDLVYIENKRVVIRGLLPSVASGLTLEERTILERRNTILFSEQLIVRKAA